MAVSFVLIRQCVMRKVFILSIILAFVLSAYGQQGDKPIKLQSDLVTIDVTVTDKDGNFIRNLKANDFTIYDEEDSEKLLKSCLEQFSLQDEKGLLRKVRHQISSAKNDLIEPEQADREFAQLYTLYQHKLKACNALDFDDLLFLTQAVGAIGARVLDVVPVARE